MVRYTITNGNVQIDVQAKTAEELSEVLTILGLRNNPLGNLVQLNDTTQLDVSQYREAQDRPTKLNCSVISSSKINTAVKQ